MRGTERNLEKQGPQAQTRLDPYDEGRPASLLVPGNAVPGAKGACSAADLLRSRRGAMRMIPRDEVDHSLAREYVQGLALMCKGKDRIQNILAKSGRECNNFEQMEIN